MDDFWIRIYLVRHGHVSYFDKEDNPVNPKYAKLSAKGIDQIQLLAEIMKDVSFRSIYASTLPRAIQTVEILTKHHQTSSFLAVDAIREIKSGRLKDINTNNAEKEIKDAYFIQTNNLRSFLNGESWEEFNNRVITWFEQTILSKSEGQNILISSHDAVNRTILRWIYGNRLADIFSYEQDYGCLNILDINIKNNKIYKKRVKLQNFTVYNPLKKCLFDSSMDEVYSVYINRNGFKE